MKDQNEQEWRAWDGPGRHLARTAAFGPSTPFTLACAGARPNHGPPAVEVRDGTLELLLGRWLMRQSRLDCAPTESTAALHDDGRVASWEHLASRSLTELSELSSHNIDPSQCPAARLPGSTDSNR